MPWQFWFNESGVVFKDPPTPPHTLLFRSKTDGLPLSRRTLDQNGILWGSVIPVASVPLHRSFALLEASNWGKAVRTKQGAASLLWLCFLAVAPVEVPGVPGGAGGLQTPSPPQAFEARVFWLGLVALVWPWGFREVETLLTPTSDPRDPLFAPRLGGQLGAAGILKRLKENLKVSVLRVRELQALLRPASELK